MILSFSVGRQERKAVNFAMTRLSINAVTKSLAMNTSRNETEGTSLKSDVGRVCSPKQVMIHQQCIQPLGFRVEREVFDLLLDKNSETMMSHQAALSS